MFVLSCVLYNLHDFDKICCIQVISRINMSQKMQIFLTVPEYLVGLKHKIRLHFALIAFFKIEMECRPKRTKNLGTPKIEN